MSGHYPHQAATPLEDPSGPRFASIYGPQQRIPAPLMPVTRNPQDGLAFWFRPDNSMPLDDRHEMIHSTQSHAPSLEAVKHRRTRSGCFTCRSRRVKCDEARPICDRCKKGKRDCEFPQLTTSGKPSSRKASITTSEDRDDVDVSDGDGSEKQGLATIKDEAEDDEEPLSPNSKRIPTPGKSRKHSIPSHTRKQKYRHNAETVTSIKEKAQSPSSDSTTSSISGTQTPASSFHTASSSTRTTPIARTRWAHLKKDLQKYLDFQHDHMTSYHYLVTYDQSDFFHGSLINLALKYEPLLYAVVGFAAFYHTLRQPNGKLSNFLAYYSRSLTLLRKSLSEGHPHTDATILTILQLASFEECLGDWPTLIGHHRAAHGMLLELYTKESIMNTEVGRGILAWYSRFDLVAGLLAGNEAILPREWYVYTEQWYSQARDPDDVDTEHSFLWFSAIIRLIGLDMAALFSKLPRGAITPQEFMIENVKIEKRLLELRSQIQSMNDEYYTVIEFPDRQPLGPQDIVDPYMPGGLFKDPLYSLNFSWSDWYSSQIMRKYQTALLLRQTPPHEELERLSLDLIRIYDAIDRWPESPPGAGCGLIAGLGLSMLFLPKDQRHTMWCRKRLASVEQNGFVFPTTFRSKMAEMWHLPEVNNWWLPEDEGFTPLLRDIRNFIKERAAAYDASTGDDLRDDLRDMKAIFSKLNIVDSPKSSPSDGSAGAISGRSP